MNMLWEEFEIAHVEVVGIPKDKGEKRRRIVDYCEAVSI